MARSLRSRIGRVLRRPGAFPLRFAYELLNPVSKSPYGPETPYFDRDLRMFHFHGSFRQIGRQFAMALPMGELLRASARYVERLSQVDRALLEGEIGDVKVMLDEVFPEMREMIGGVCEVERDYGENLVVLSTFATVLMNEPRPASCSSLAFIRRHRPVVAQNLDLGRSNEFAAAYIVPDAGRAVVAHVTPGFLWFGTGVNEDGLCVAGSSTCVIPETTAPRRQFPQELVSGYLLWKAGDAAAACELLSKLPYLGPANGGLNLCLADGAGCIRNVEMVHATMEMNDDEAPLWITTNHFRTTALSSLNRCDDSDAESLLYNSKARYERAVQRFQAARGEIESLRLFLRESGTNGSWCRNATPPDEGYTSVSYLIDLEEETIEYWYGILESQPRPLKFNLATLFKRELLGSRS